MVLYATIAIAFVLAIYPSFFPHRGPVMLLLIIPPVLASYIASIFLYRKTIGAKIFLWVVISIAALLVKALDGIFANFFWRFFIDVTLYLLIGSYLLKRGLSFLQIFLILFAPSILLFALFTNPTSEIQRGAYPLLSTNFIALGLLSLYQWLRNKIATMLSSIAITALLAFVAYPNLLSVLNGWKMITKTTAQDKRTYLPLLQENGKQTTVQEIGNKITVIDTWFTGCGICFEKFPELQKLSDHYKNDSSVYIAALNFPLEKELTTNDAFSAVGEYHFIKMKSAASITNNLWGITQFPTLLIFDKQHRLRYSGNLETDDAVMVNNTYRIIEKLKAE